MSKCWTRSAPRHGLNMPVCKERVDFCAAVVCTACGRSTGCTRVPTTFTFELAAKFVSLVVSPTPWNRTAVEVLSCTGANTMKTVGLEILSAEIPTTPNVALIPQLTADFALLVEAVLFGTAGLATGSNGDRKTFQAERYFGVAAFTEYNCDIHEPVVENWGGDCSNDTDNYNYDEQLDQREGALNRGRGTLGHRFCTLRAHDIALGSRAKVKKTL